MWIGMRFRALFMRKNRSDFGHICGTITLNGIFVDVLPNGLRSSVGLKFTNSGYYYYKTKTEALVVKTR